MKITIASPVNKLKKELDKVFSEFIRLKSVDKYGRARCVTCNCVKNWKELQCGHFNKRSLSNTRYDEENNHVQCVGCNVFKNGNYPEYTKFLLDTIGEKKLLELIKRGREIKRFTSKELYEKIIYYREKVEELKKLTS